MRLAYVIACLLIPVALVADNLNGIWKGILTQGAGGCYAQYFIEFHINFTDNSITGKAYDYYDTTKFVKMSFTGRYNPQTHRLVLIENKVLEYSIPIDCAPCLKTYDLIYEKNGADEKLSGEWKGHLMNRSNTCPPGKISLKKTNHADFPVDIEQNDTLVDLQKTLRLQPRGLTLAKTLVIDSPKIKLEFYDDGEIDGDTITVFVNNKLLLYQQRLSDRPLTIYLNAFPGTEYELVMYADNLGSIPPNTALMIATSGDKRYEVYLSSSEQKSASVKFVYKPK